jgi:N-acetylneuraminate synthase
LIVNSRTENAQAPDNCYIIAEAGVNHNGSMELAAQLVEQAAAAGADAVKFQTFKAEHVVTRAAKKAAYQIENTKEDGSQIDMIRQLELSHDEFSKLSCLAATANIDFLSTAFDGESLAFLVDYLAVQQLKIPSGELTNGPYLLDCASRKLPLIVSTGMCDLEEIALALDVIAYGLTVDKPPVCLEDFSGLADSGPGRIALSEKVTLLHCTTEYPTPFEDVNLRAMDTIATRFGLPVGYSDHTRGITVPVAAVARGAITIEKHFTLDRNLPGPDHAASLEPDELKAMVQAIREVSSALGSLEKEPAKSERKNIPIARRSLVAAEPVRKGEVFTPENLTAKRPGDGVSPMRYWDTLGEVASRDYDADEKIGQ